MSRRNLHGLNYNVEEALRNVRHGLPPFLPAVNMAPVPPPSGEVTTSTMSITTSTLTDTIAAITTAPAMISGTVQEGLNDEIDLITISAVGYRNIILGDADLFRSLTDTFLTEIEDHLALFTAINSIDAAKEELICRQIKSQLETLLKVVDENTERIENPDPNVSFTDVKVKYEELLSSYERKIAEYTRKKQAKIDMMNQRLGNSLTPIPEVRTSSRIQQPFQQAQQYNNITTYSQPQNVHTSRESPPRRTLPGGFGDPPQNGTRDRGYRDGLRTFRDIDNESDDSIADTFSELTFDGSWRLLNYTGYNINAINIHSAVLKIASITRTDIGRHTDECTLKAMDSRDVPQLKDCIKAITKNLAALPDNREFRDLRTYACHAVRAGYKYTKAIEDLVKEKGLHIQSDNTTASPLVLEKFDGYDSKETNVYEFLTQFALVCKGMTQRELAEYMYCNYISTGLQKELKHIRHNFAEMKALLIKKYGKINRLLRERKQQLRDLVPAVGKSSKQAKVIYLNKVMEILLQLQGLVEDNKDTKPGLEVEVYNYDSLMDLVSNIAEPFKTSFLGEYITYSSKMYDDDDVPGEQMFQLLLKYLRNQIRKLDLTLSITCPPDTNLDKKPTSTRYINTFDQYAEAEDYTSEEDDFVSDQEDGPSALVATTTKIADQMFNKDNKSLRKYTDDGLWHPATCFMHPTTFARVKDCRMGECPIFLGALPGDRNIRAEEKGRCKLCFMRKCLRNQNNEGCIFKDSIGQSLSCKACLVAGKSINILLCGSHDTSASIKKDELVSFLAGYKEDIFVKFHTLSILKISAGKGGDIVTPDPGRKSNLAYNVSDGSHIAKTDILHKISKEPSCDSPLYVLQTVNIGGKEVILMYDSGAGGEVCTTELAESLKLEVLDPQEQFIRVASGKVVPTGGCVYAATLGPDPNGHYHEISLTGMTKITNNMNYYDLSDIITEFKINQASTPLSKEVTPPFIGGGGIGLIIGIKQSSLFPTLLMTLPTGISVWRSRLTDIHGSTLIFSGPHHSITRQMTEPKRINLMFTQTAESFLYSHHNKTIPSWDESLVSPQVIQFQSKDDDLNDAHAYNLYKDVCECIPSNKELVLQCCCEETDMSSINSFEKGFFMDNTNRMIANIKTHSLLEDFIDKESFKDSESRHFSEDIILTLVLSQPETSEPAIIESNINKVDHDHYVLKYKQRIPNQTEQDLKEQEEAGCKVDYRCEDCQGCLKCKNSARTRDVSVRDLLEETLIKRSHHVDTNNNTTWARYPFTRDPDTFLKERWNGRDNNYYMAARTLNSMRNKPKEVKDGVIAFHNTLLQNNYAKKLSDLPLKLQQEIHSAPLKHYFPWKVVQKPGSTSTPYRMVCDPSITDFNSCLAKGTNCLTSLFEIVMEWRTFRFAFCSDLAKMFNSLRLRESEYRYSLYLFSSTLSPEEIPEVYVLITIIYGLRSAANQCTSALREVTELYKQEYPRANAVVERSTYMDDSGHGAQTKEERSQIIDELKIVLPRAGFKLKTVNLSGEDPDEAATSDGKTTTFGGYKWSQKEDLLFLNHGEINFHKKFRGAKKPNESPIETDEDLECVLEDQKLTRRNLLGKSLELYDLCGIVEPLKAKLKIDLRVLIGYDFDLEIPSTLRPLWIENLKMIQHSRDITWNRSVVPHNAINPDRFDLICFVDAASSMAGTAIYTRFLCNDGSYYSQLLTARSKSCSGTIPRNELESALLGTQTMHIVMNRLGTRVNDYIVVTDSEISLFWITNPENRLKSYVFNRVRNIHRLLNPDRFFHVAGTQNIADILTRGEITLEELDKGSVWQDGPEWLSSPFSEMPLRSPTDIRKLLTKDQEAHISRESVPNLLNDQDFPDKTNMCASLNSIGMICCQNFDITAECHCTPGVICCMCAYDPALLDIDIQDCELTDSTPKDTLMHINPCERDDLKNLLRLKRFGFLKSVRLIGLVYRFITRTRHRSHIKNKVNNPLCHLCTPTVIRESMDKLPLGHRFIPTPYEIHLAWNCLCKRATAEVLAEVSPKKIAAYDNENGILVSGGRLSYPDLLVDNPELPYFPDLKFKAPVALVKSDLVISLATFIHWDVLHHPGVEIQVNFMLRIVHVENLRFLIKKLRNQCPRCRYLVKKRPIASTGNQSKLAMLKCPAFYATMLDIGGPFAAHNSIMQKETRNPDSKTKKAYMLIFVCLTSSATNICVLEDMTTESIVQAILRHSNRYSVPKFLIADNQSSFTTLKHARFQFQDVQGRLWKDQRIILEYSTPLYHQGHGKVEVRMKLTRELLDRTAESGKKHSFLKWETIGSTIANMLNNLPIAHCSDQNGIDDPIFLITPNSLLLGKNQNRSVSGPIDLADCTVEAQFTKVNELTEMIQTQISQMIHKYVPGRKVYSTSPPLVGEIVIFVMSEAQRSRNVGYKFGRIIANYVDGRENKVTIKYKNSTETVFRKLDRHVEEIVIILSLEDLKFDTMHDQLLETLQSKYN